MDDESRWKSTVDQVSSLANNVRVYGQFTSKGHDPRYQHLADRLDDLRREAIARPLASPQKRSEG